MTRNPIGALVLVAGLLLAWPVSAEVFTWVDGHGRMHMADDLSKVPAEYRVQAQKGMRDSVEKPRSWTEMEGGGVHVTPAESDPASTPKPVKGLKDPKKTPKPKIFKLQVDRAGSEMSLVAELDGGVRAPFIVDTGAMLNTMPAWVAEELGVTIDEDTAQTLVTGISGTPMMVPVITVRSVNLGGAEVEDVDFAILSTQNRGLLGMPFFNHFKVSTDPLSGVLTLEEIDLENAEGVYGGHNEDTWKRKFRMVRYMLGEVERYRAAVPEGILGSDAAFEELDTMEEYWERQMDDLELKASRAGVPRAWRE